MILNYNVYTQDVCIYLVYLNTPNSVIHMIINYLSNDIKEVGGGLDAAELGLDELDEAVGQDLDHRLRRQLVHGVVLLVRRNSKI